MTTDSTEFLAHFGIPGMKWGQRHDYVKVGYGPRAAVPTPAVRSAPKSPAQMRDLGKAAISNRLRPPSPKPNTTGSKATSSPKAVKARSGKIPGEGKLKHTSVDELKRRAKSEQDRLELKAGRPPTAKEQKNGLSRNQKIALGVGIGAVAVGAAFAAHYGLKKLNAIKLVKKAELSASIDKKIEQDLLKEDAYLKEIMGNRHANVARSNKVLDFQRTYMDRVEKSSQVMTKARFDKLGTEEVNVPAGTVFKRLVTDPNESMNKRLYVSFTDADNDRYQAVYGDSLKQRTAKMKLHLNEMTSKVDIKSPSAKKRVELLTDMLNENKQIPGVGDSTRSAKNLLYHMLSDANIKPDFEPPGTNEELAIKYYNAFARGLVIDHPLVNEYYKKTKEAGYNALIDDNDAGQLADAPMILLNAAEVISDRKSTEFTQEMEAAAIDRLKDLV